MAITRLPPPPFSTRQLQYAVAVAETRSFRQAAELCGVSQPSLSAQLAQLEDALGVRLFERDRRRVLTTAAGEALVVRARRILAETDDLMGQPGGSGIRWPARCVSGSSPPSLPTFCHGGAGAPPRPRPTGRALDRR